MGTQMTPRIEIRLNYCNTMGLIHIILLLVFGLKYPLLTTLRIFELHVGFMLG